MSSSVPPHRIGVVADTHSRFHPRLPELLAGVDEIWHLGDICEDSIIDRLREIQPNMTVVLGNNDFTLHYPMTRTLERGKEKFYLIHILGRQWPTDVNWVLFGHTHVPRDEVSNGIRFLNPGSAGKGNKGAPNSLAILTSTNGEPYVPQLHLL